MSYLRGPLTKEQVAQAEACAAAGAAAPPPQRRRARRRADDRAAPAAPAAELGADETPIPPPVAAGVAGLVPRPGRAVGVGRSARSPARRGCAPSSRRGCRSATTTAPRTSTSRRSSRPSTGRSTAGSTSRARRRSTTTTATSRTEPPAGAVVRPARRRRSPRRSSSRRRRRTSSDTSSSGAPLELQRNRALKLVSRPGESADDFAARCDAAAQERADAEAAKIRDRLEAKRDRLDKALAQAQRRVEELDTDTRTRQANELIAGAGAVLGALFGGRRSARSMASAIGGAASRRGMTARTSRAQARPPRTKVDATQGRPRRSSSRRSSTRSPRSTSAGRRRPTRSTRSRSGSRRPTSACSRRGSCGCRATDPGSRSSRCSRRAARARTSAEHDDDAAATAAVVEWVNDGDTLTLTNGAKVRLVQIDAPELETDCYGRAALEALIAARAEGDARAARRRPDARRPGPVRPPAALRLRRGARTSTSSSSASGAASPYFFRNERGALRRRAARRRRRGARAPRRGYWGACPGAELNTGLGSVTGRADRAEPTAPRVARGRRRRARRGAGRARRGAAGTRARSGPSAGDQPISATPSRRGKARWSSPARVEIVSDQSGASTPATSRSPTPSTSVAGSQS